MRLPCDRMAADVLAPGFWDIGLYKHNVRKIKDGIDQLEDFSKMARERADIEKSYGKMLQVFNEKWRNHVERNVSSGAVKTAWLELISESDALASQHHRVKDRLVDDVVKKVGVFIKENNHTSVLRGAKEVREIEEEFDKAQRPWKKRFDKMESSKKAYYTACRQEKSAQLNLQNSQSDSSVSQDGTQKLRERLEKSKDEVQKTRVAYESTLTEITNYRPTYIQGMTFAFNKCEEKEMKRSKFFVDVINGTEQVYADLVRNNKFNQMHESLELMLRGTNDSVLTADWEHWSRINGTNAHTDWPAFEEYSPEMRTISSRGQPQRSAEPGGVVLTRQIVKNDELAALPPGPASSGNSDNGKSSSDSDSNTFDSRKTGTGRQQQHSPPTKQAWDGRSANDSPPLSMTTPDSAKYGDFDDFHATKSVATVLYDYNPVEGDEIPLKKGETIEVLSEPDSLGWCTGKRNGEIGLFPASYVQVV